MTGRHRSAARTIFAGLLLGSLGLAAAAAHPQRPREGRLRVGDTAPDFSLETYDRTQRFILSSYRGEKPVVLVFGSYT